MKPVAVNSTAFVPVVDRIIGDSPEQTVNARELHALLEAKVPFEAWIAAHLAECDFVEGRDFRVTAEEGYILTLSMAQELAIFEPNAKGRQYREYLLGCERQVQGPDTDAQLWEILMGRMARMDGAQGSGAARSI